MHYLIALIEYIVACFIFLAVFIGGLLVVIVSILLALIVNPFAWIAFILIFLLLFH